jgi:hypothetical protein
MLFFKISEKHPISETELRILTIFYILGTIVMPIVIGACVTYSMLALDCSGYDKYIDHQDQIHVAQINAQMFQNSQYNMTCRGWCTILGGY